MKPLNQVALISALVIFLTGIITVKSSPPQPIETTVSPVEQLPPEVFPKEDSNGSIPHHLQGELPPAIFPDDKALAQLHADLITKSASKSDLNNKNNIKDTELDGKSNKTAAGSKTTKVASEIPDLLNTDYMNITTYDDGTENPINNDTETVKGPHVINDNKTHDEDASSVQRNCSANESTGSQEYNSTLKNECMDDAIKNETIEENHSNDKNDSTISTSTELTTEPEMKQTSTEDVTETTTSLNNLTNGEYENVTDIAEPKNVEDTLSTLEYNTTTGLPTTENSTVVTENKSDNATIEVQSKSDNNATSVDISTTPATKETVGTTKQTSTNSNTTELPSAKVETTSVNISENIIDHKSGSSPVALAASQQHGDHSHGSSGKSSAFLQPTESAAILAGVFVGIALLGYVGLLVWRRILERRYGNREMLVNEDDFYDTNDLRNFEL